jgi:hypothetical protein
MALGEVDNVLEPAKDLLCMGEELGIVARCRLERDFFEYATGNNDGST